MAEIDFSPQRVTRTYRQTIHAPADEVFPLLCPVREAEWLDGWSYQMIYSRSGVVEEGAVFSTTSPGEPDTVWVVTCHNPEQRRIVFSRFTPESRTCVLTIHVQPKEEHRSSVDISYTYTGLSPAGNAFIDSFTQEEFLAAVTFWERSMNHFLATGEKLKKSGSH